MANLCGTNFGLCKCFASSNPYLSLLKYLAPLAITLVAIDIGEQALNRALSSSVNAIETLAAFGIAYMIVKLATGIISEVKLVSIMLVHHHEDRNKIIRCVLFAGVVNIAISILIGFTAMGRYVIDELHGIPSNIGFEARMTIIYLSAFPVIDGLAWVHAGILLKFKYSFTVGAASLIDNVVQVFTVIILLRSHLPSTNPVVIPVLATYFGTIARFLTVVIVYYKFLHVKLSRTIHLGFNDEFGIRTRLTLKNVLAFWAPLALVQVCQRICRPIVNLLMARDRLDGTTKEMAVKAVAVLSLCYPIGHLPYGWLNTLRSVEPAFKQKTEEDAKTISIRNIRIFNICCFLLSILIMIILFWIPGVAPAILTNVSNAESQLIDNAVRVLRVFSFFPIPVANRANLTGMFISRKQTKFLYPSVPIRIIVLLAMLFLLPRVGIHGAIMGVSALFCAFLSESLCLLLIKICLNCKEMKSITVERTDSIVVAEAETSF